MFIVVKTNRRDQNGKKCKVRKQIVKFKNVSDSNAT